MRPVRNADAEPEKTKTKTAKPIPRLEVFCRLRRPDNLSEGMPVQLMSPRELVLLPPYGPGPQRRVMQYNFTHVFTEHAGQKDVFEEVALPLLHGLLHGKHGLLLTYGVTGSGKTYTMTGQNNVAGVVPRCITTLFNTIGQSLVPRWTFKSDKYYDFEIQSPKDAHMDRKLEDRNKHHFKKRSSESTYENDGTRITDVQENKYLYAVYVSHVEIYNNVIYDLLDEDPVTKKLQAKILREGLNQHVYVHNVCEVEVESADEIFDILAVGAKRRRVAQTKLNAASSRSHSIFTVRVIKVLASSLQEGKESRANPTVTQLMLVDLAGSERINRTQNTGMRLKEAGSINNCLMLLRTCLRTLRDNHKNGVNNYVPYRERKLTHLFKHYFEGHGNISMIVCMNPSFKDYEENLQVLEFAEMAQEIELPEPEQEPEPEPEVEPDPSTNTSDAGSFEELIIDYSDEEQEPYSFTALPSDNLLVRFTTDVSKIKPERIMHSLTTNWRKHQMDVVHLKRLAKRFRVRANYADKNRATTEYKIDVAQHMLGREKSVSGMLRKELDSKVHKNLKLKAKAQDQLDEIEKLRVDLAECEFQEKQSQLDVQRHKDKLEKLTTQVQLERERDIKRQRELNELKEKKKAEARARSEERRKSLEKKRNEGRKSDGKHSRRVSSPDTPTSSDNDQKVLGPIRAAPVVNVRSRYSQALDKAWLEHRPKHMTPINTVFQPNLKKRKSITQLKDVKNLTQNKKSRYLLLSQGQDSHGNLKTNLFKGDILPTCGGGAQVIFDDVEVLKQKDPNRSFNLHHKKF